jgi:hypothetical protein
MSLFRYLALGVVIPLHIFAIGDCIAPSSLCQRLDPDMVVFIGKPTSIAPEEYGAVTVTFDAQELLWGPPGLRSIRVLLDGYGNKSSRPEFFAVKPLRDSRYLEDSCVGLNLPASHPFVDEFRRSVVARRPSSVSVKAQWQWYVPVAGADVQLSGNGRTFQGSVRGDAGWQIAALPPGHYRVTTTRANFSQSWPKQQVSILPASCADLRIGMETNSAVTGRVVDSRGEPMRNATFHLSGQGRALSENLFSLTFLRDAFFGVMGWSTVRAPAYPLYIHTRTDSDGRFVFRNVFPGWYYLSSDISEVNENFQIPLPNAYYPGVYGWPEAKHLVVAEGHSIHDVLFQLPDFGRQRHVAVLVLSEDGAPVPSAIVQDSGLDPANRKATNSGAHRTTDAAGRCFSISGRSAIIAWWRHCGGGTTSGGRAGWRFRPANPT